MPSIRWLVLFAALLLSDVARAQVSFTDGFEGQLLQFQSPPGVWDFIGLQYPNQQMVTEVAAVKRGALGLRAIDSHGDAGVDSQVVLGRNITGSGNQYTRVWWRVSASNGIPGALSFLMTQGNTTIGTLAETKWNPATNEVRLVCFDRNGMFFSPASPTTVPQDGRFHLIELALVNVGTVAATCSYAVDGSERARQQYDHTGTQFSNILVGPVYGESEWTGVMDYDDFAASSSPIASRADLTPNVLRHQACEPVVIRTLSSFSAAPAPVGTLTRVVVAVDGGAAFSDNRCLVRLPGSLQFTPGASTRSLFLRADSLSFSVRLESDDLVETIPPLTVVPADAGIDAGAVDAGAVDAGTLTDAGMADAGSPNDAGAIVDAGFTSDAGTTGDAGSTDDAGTTDAGFTNDAGMTGDAGSTDDAGTTGDAGSTNDAGTASDGGPVVDAGVSPGVNDYAVGCGCSSENGILAASALLLLLLTKRRG